MNKLTQPPYEAPAMVIRIILPPKVLCISGGEYDQVTQSGYDYDSD